MLFGSQFDIATPIKALKTPKLLIAGGPNSSPARDPASLERLFQQASSPRFIVALPTAGANGTYQATVSRFLDQYMTSP
jgi:hypothetical protein